MKWHPVFLGLSVAATLLTVSCVDPMYGTGSHASYGGRVTTYSTLPSGYSGSAYQYNGRYYSGGRYESGNYAYQGRNYSNRYYHDGQYLYGGNHQHYQGPSRSSRYGGRNSHSSHDHVSDLPSSRSPFHLRHPTFGRRL